MLTEVEARSGQGILVMPLEDVADGIIIENIDGLDPVKATIVSSTFATMDGTQYHASRRESRNIVFRLGLDPIHESLTVSQLRKKLYGYFMPKSPVDFTFRDSDGSSYNISGRVESCETPLFTKEPAVDISVICFDPDFIAPDVVTMFGNTVSDTTTFQINYLGTVETGITFTISPQRPITDFTIYNTWPDGTNNNLEFTAPLEAFDHLIIETTPGEKSVTQYRNNSIFASPLYGVPAQSAWTELQPGINTLRVFCEGDPVQFDLAYRVRYGGL
jgi:hypothetical protein